jgi:hypothetical protein
MAKTKTNKEYLENLETTLAEIKKHLPNGDLKQIQITLEGISVKQEDIVVDIAELKEVIDKLQKNIYNPEDGFVVRINKNTDYRRFIESLQSKGVWANASKKIDRLWDWRDSVNRALWVVYAAVIGLLLKLVFFGGTTSAIL